VLWDAVRVITRLLDRAEALRGAPAVRWRDRRRLAKKRARAIEYSRGQDKKRQLYRDLVAATQASRAELQAFATELAETAKPAVAHWRAEVDHYLPLIGQARQMLEQLMTITSVVIPSTVPFRNPEHRDLFLSGLRLAAGETA